MMTESHHKPGPAEMANLARRLRACAESVLRRDQPEQQRDSFTAASWEWRGRVVRVDRPRPTGGCRVGTPFRRPPCFIAIRR